MILCLKICNWISTAMANKKQLGIWECIDTYMSSWVKVYWKYFWLRYSGSHGRCVYFWKLSSTWNISSLLWKSCGGLCKWNISYVCQSIVISVWSLSCCSSQLKVVQSLDGKKKNHIVTYYNCSVFSHSQFINKTKSRGSCQVIIIGSMRTCVSQNMSSIGFLFDLMLTSPFNLQIKCS